MHVQNSRKPHFDESAFDASRYRTPFIGKNRPLSAQHVCQSIRNAARIADGL
jgi:hypothetical protein